jgi:hypothetical protein
VPLFLLLAAAMIIRGIRIVTKPLRSTVGADRRGRIVPRYYPMARTCLKRWRRMPDPS